jgi:hypothetical protein
MHCEAIPIPGAGVAIVCSRGRGRRPRCQVEGCRGEDGRPRPSVAQCDYPLSPPAVVLAQRRAACGCLPVTTEARTCDLHLCADHRHPVPGHKSTDYCPAHHHQAEETPAHA